MFGLSSENLSLVVRDIGSIRYQTWRKATMSTIAEANVDITWSIFVRSRQRSTTYRLKRSSSMWSQQFAITGKEICLQFFCYFSPVTRHSVQTMWTIFSRKDFFRFIDGLLTISTRKTNAEPRCLTSLGGHDGAICAAKHLELVHAYHTDLTNSIWEPKIYQTCMSCPY